MDAVARLAELKAKVPNVKCKGFCFRSCTGIHLTKLEQELIEERHGIHIPMAPADLVVRYGDRTTCPALDEDRRCRIHEDKEAYPLVCSGFGATDHMPCFFGCEVEGDPMRMEDYRVLDCEVNEVGGSPYQTPMDRARLKQLLSTRTGVRRFREAMLKLMEKPWAWWRSYIERFPEGEK